MIRLRGFGWCGLLAIWLEAAGADVVTLAPVRDNTLFEDASGSLSNGAGPVLFAGNNGQGLERRALIAFDVAAHLPPGVSVSQVTLELNVSNAPNTVVRTFTLHRLLRSWGEGSSSTTSGGGVAAATGDATWLHTYSPSGLWETPGGDFVAAASAAQSIAGLGPYEWSGAGMVADVQRWLDDPGVNFGWSLASEEEELNTARRFDSRESSTVASRPSLAITYSNAVAVPGETVQGHGPWLAPCRPNPAVGRVRVAFELAAAADVRLEVLDLAGRRAATLAKGRLEPGRHEAEWTGRGESGETVASGVYFYRLVVDGRRIASRRMVWMGG